MSSSNSNPSNGSSPHVGPRQGDEVGEDSVQIDMAEIAKKLNLPEKTVAMKIRAAASIDHEEHGIAGTPQSTSYNIRKGTLKSRSTPDRRPSAASSVVSPMLPPGNSSTASVPIQLDPQSAASASPSSYVGSLKNTVDNLGAQSPHRKHFVLLKRPSMLGDGLGDGGGSEEKKASSLSADGAGFSGGKSESSLSAAGRGGGYLAVRKGSNLDPASNARLDHTAVPDGDISEAYLLAAPQAQSPQQNSSGFISLRRGEKKGSVIMSVHNSHLSNNDGINGGDDDDDDAKSDHSSRSGGNVVVQRTAPGSSESEHLLGNNKSNSSISLAGVAAANTGPEGSINDNNDTTQKSRKQVHFPEDVVNQITIVHRENSLVMQVEYNRPLIAYVGCLLSVLLLVVAWCQISKAAFYTDAMTGDLHNGVVSRSVALISSFAFLSTTVILVVWCIATGVPSFDERASLQHFHHRRKLAICSLTGSAGLVLMASAFMLHVSSINFVVYSMWPLIFSYLWHIYKTREISRIDAVGLILAIAGTGIMIIGEVNRSDYQSTSRRWIAVTLSFIAAIAETLRWNHEKQSRRYFSNALVMLCTTGIAGVVLLIIALVLKAFTEPIGRGAEILSELDRSNAGLIIGACIAMFAATTTSHAAAVYFDTLTMISIVAMSGPLCVLAYGWFDLPTMELVYRGVGGCTMAFGSFLLIFTGFVFRRHVELVFALPGEEEEETPVTSLREE